MNDNSAEMLFQKFQLTKIEQWGMYHKKMKHEESFI